jgi:hypothetical protein
MSKFNDELKVIKFGNPVSKKVREGMEATQKMIDERRKKEKESKQ